MKKHRKRQRKSKAERQYEARIETFFAAMTILLLLFPMAAYCALVYFVFPPDGHLAFSVLGVVGSFCFGALLSYIINRRVSQRILRLRKCLPVFFACVFSIAVSLLCMYVPAISRLFDGNHVAAYFTLWLILAFDAVCYVVFFRVPMRTWLRCEKGVRGFSRAQAGLPNLLWYQDIHRQRNIGMIYPVNLSFSLVFLLAIGLHLLLGWQRLAVLPVCILTGLSGTLETILMCLVAGRLLSDESGQGYGLFSGSGKSAQDIDILSGNIAIILYLFGTAVISFALPSLLKL